MSGYIPRSKSDKWGTPKELYDKLYKIYSKYFDMYLKFI